MSAPTIIYGFSWAAVVPFLLAAATAWLFWTRVVPRQLRGLQVAFQTGEKRYEVHQITRTTQDARELLSSKDCLWCGIVHPSTGRCLVAVF